MLLDFGHQGTKTLSWVRKAWCLCGLVASQSIALDIHFPDKNPLLL